MAGHQVWDSLRSLPKERAHRLLACFDYGLTLEARPLYRGIFRDYREALVCLISVV